MACSSPGPSIFKRIYFWTILYCKYSKILHHLLLFNFIPLVAFHWTGSVESCPPRTAQSVTESPLHAVAEVQRRPPQDIILRLDKSGLSVVHHSQVLYVIRYFGSMSKRGPKWKFGRRRHWVIEVESSGALLVKVQHSQEVRWLFSPWHHSEKD